MNDRNLILGLLLIIGSVVAPAWNLTFAELADKYDDSLTTKFQPELLITAWGSAVATTAGSVLLYLTRNKPKP